MNCLLLILKDFIRQKEREICFFHFLLANMFGIDNYLTRKGKKKKERKKKTEVFDEILTELSVRC